jgi:hypothetical protein
MIIDRRRREISFEIFRYLSEIGLYVLKGTIQYDSRKVEQQSCSFLLNNEPPKFDHPCHVITHTIDTS